MHKLALIVDDDETLNEKAVNFFKLGGFEPIVKHSILEGIELIKKQYEELDLILLKPKVLFIPLLLKTLKGEIYSHIKIIFYKSSNIKKYQFNKLDKENFHDPLNFFKF